MMDINGCQWFPNFVVFFIKSLLIQAKKQELILMYFLRINKKQKNYTSQLLEKMKNVKYTLSFKDNIWGADLVDIKLISKFNKVTLLLLCY